MRKQDEAKLKDSIQCERGLAPYGGKCGGKPKTRVCSVCGIDTNSDLCFLHAARARKNVVLDEEKVRYIRAERAAGATVVSIAEHLRANRSTVQKVCDGVNWRAIGEKGQSNVR